MNGRDIALWSVAGVAAVAGVASAVALVRRRDAQRLQLPMPDDDDETTAIQSVDELESVVLLAPKYDTIGMKEAEGFRRALSRTTPPLGIVLHTLGGSALAVDYIAEMLDHYPGDTIAYVPYYALSGGTMVALAADEIVMDEAAVLGPVDPQIHGLPANTLVDLPNRKSPDRIEDHWLVLAEESRKHIAETERLVRGFVQSEAAVQRLTSGATTHGHRITFSDARRLGLPVKKGVPPEIFAMVDRRPRRRPGCWGPLFMESCGRVTRLARE